MFCHLPPCAKILLDGLGDLSTELEDAQLHWRVSIIVDVEPISKITRGVNIQNFEIFIKAGI